MLPKLFWRRFRCADCGHAFELPLDDTTLPPHARADGAPCHGCDAVPV
jgi:primosomal protein N'